MCEKITCVCAHAAVSETSPLLSLSDSRRSPPLPPTVPPLPPSSTSQDSAMSTMESTLSGKARYSANEAIKWEPTASSSLQSEATGRQIRSRVGHWLGSHGNKDGYGGGTGRTICVIICTRYLPAWPTLHGGDARARRGDWKMLGFLYTQIKLFVWQRSLPSDYLTMLSTYKYSHVSLKEIK